MDLTVYIGVAIALLAIVGLSIYTGTKGNAKKSGLSSPVVAGLIIGTLVGGSSTIGVAQIAYNYGMGAWCFTIGSSVGCLLLCLFYAKRLRAGNTTTLSALMRAQYGPKVGRLSVILNTVGILINVMAQLLAASAVVLVIFPRWGTLGTVVFSAVFMALYVVFGGTKGAGIVGILKMFLMYGAMITVGIIALVKMGGLSETFSLMRGYSAETGRNYFNVLSQGAGNAIGSILSTVLGVLATETYAQALLRAETTEKAKKGALVSFFVILPMGIFGILVGLYMRKVTDPATFPVKTALTEFVLSYSGIPKILAGVILGTLFIAAVGTGAGLALGVSNMLSNEFFRGKKLSESVISRILIVVILFVGTLLSCLPIGDTILRFTFMSMGLRACTCFFPVFLCLFLPGRVNAKTVFFAILAGTVITLLFGTLDIFGVLKMPFDALFLGLAAEAILLGFGFIKK